jgi:hypothetical protein
VRVSVEEGEESRFARVLRVVPGVVGVSINVKVGANILRYVDETSSRMASTTQGKTHTRGSCRGNKRGFRSLQNRKCGEQRAMLMVATTHIAVCKR